MAPNLFGVGPAIGSTAKKPMNGESRSPPATVPTPTPPPSSPPPIPPIPPPTAPTAAPIPSTPSTPITPTAAKQQQQQQQQEERVTVGDYLADSLTAQSLDLPPAAAKWRQAQRAQQLRQRRLVVWEVDDIDPWNEQDDAGGEGVGGGGEKENKEGGGGGGLVALFKGKEGGVRGGPERKKKVDIRSRVAGMLAQDREDAWQVEEEERKK